MDSNKKKFGIYVFLSTFSRSLIEVFIPVILYKFGYSIKEVLLYYLIVNLVSLLITYPSIYISNKYNNKILSIVGITSFIALQVALNYMVRSMLYLILIAVLFAFYRRGYWISRRYYNLEIIKDKNIATSYSIIMILNQLAVVVSGYIGSLILDFVSLRVLTIIAIILFALCLIPINMMKFEHEKKQYNLNLKDTIKSIPKSDIYLFGSYELNNVIKFLIPLYIVIYVKDTYQTIGLVTLITNLALLIFTFLFGKKLDKSKSNYLKIAILLTVAIYILKVNSIGFALFIVSFIEGFVSKMYELSINKEFYTLSKQFEYYNYNLMYEITQNLFRSILVFILYITNLDIRNMIYVSLAFVLFGIFLKFKPKIEEEEYEK